MNTLKNISLDRDTILMEHGYDPNDPTLQVHVSVSEIEPNPDGNEDYLIDGSSVTTSSELIDGRQNDVDLNIEIFREPH